MKYDDPNQTADAQGDLGLRNSYNGLFPGFQVNLNMSLLLLKHAKNFKVSMYLSQYRNFPG